MRRLVTIDRLPPRLMPYNHHMHLIINGEQVEVDDTVTTVQTLLASKQLTGSPCAVEVNATLVPKRQHAEHELNDGDRVEIVTLVGGG